MDMGSEIDIKGSVTIVAAAKRTHRAAVPPFFILVLSLAGCADLKAVREFGGQSARLAGYTELTIRFRDTYERERPYLTGEADRLARENDKRRQAAYEDLVSIHQTVSWYMKTLAKLAGDDTFDLSKGVGAMATGIKAWPDLGIEKTQVDAVSNLAKVAASQITSAAQQHAVRRMIREGDPPLQITIEKMVTLVRLYRETHENEKKTVLGFLDVEIPFADSPKERLLAALAVSHAQSKAAEYRLQDQKYVDTEKGLAAIAEGHRQLYEHLDDLSSEQVASMVLRLAKDIETVNDSLQVIRRP
jgi:hypothetical protein